MKINISTIALFLIIPFSGFYLTKLPLSPIYIFLFTGFIFSFISALQKISAPLNFKKTLFITLILIFYLSITSTYNSSVPSPTIGAILSLLTFSIILIIIDKVNLQQTRKISYLLPKLSLPLLIIEAAYRYMNPLREEEFINAGREDILFYIYKFNSIMYIDSNFVALYILMLIFFLIYLDNHFQEKNRMLELILVILLVLTISRAAIIAYAFTRILFIARKIIYKFRRSLIPIFISTLPFIFYWIALISNIDDSLASKFLILTLLLNYISNASVLELFLGIGLGNAERYIDIGAHNIIATYIIEIGLIGSLLTSLIWISSIVLSKYKTLILIIPFVISGFSLTSLSIPYFYAMLAIIIYLERSYKK